MVVGDKFRSRVVLLLGVSLSCGGFMARSSGAEQQGTANTASGFRVEAAPSLNWQPREADPAADSSGSSGPFEQADFSLCGDTDWSQVPAICPMPRPGIFSFPPRGSGYYSLADRKRDQQPPASGQ